MSHYLLTHAPMERVRAAVDDRRADVFLLLNSEYSGQPGTRYLCGFTGSSSALVIANNSAHLLTDGRYAAQAKEESPECEQLLVGGGGYLAAVADILGRLASNKILVDGARTSFAGVLRLKELLPQADVHSTPNLLQEIRQVKTAEEIESIALAGTIAGRAYERLLRTITVGMTERAVVARLEQFMKDEGAERIAFDTIVASGTNGAMPHARPTEKPLAAGEFVTIDFGAVWGGYACDITRTVGIGEPASALRDVYDAVREAQRKGIAAVRRGVSGADVDAACRSSLTAKGYGAYFAHATGHGLGMEVHELPVLGATATTPLQAGSVITIEPGVYIPGFGGVRIEDDIVVEPEGSTNLTEHLSRELPVLPFA
jgi:Xaa-Pro aminopeptidase